MQQTERKQRKKQGVLAGIIALTVVGGSLTVVTATQEQAEPEQIQYHVQIVNGEDQSPVESACVKVTGTAGTMEQEGNNLTFTMPKGSSFQAEIEADQYESVTGIRHSVNEQDTSETIAIYPAAAEASPEVSQPVNENPSGEEAGDEEAVPEPIVPETSQPEQEVMAETPVPAETPVSEEVPETMTPENLEPNENGVPETAPPAWAEAGEHPLKGNLIMAEEMRLLEGELEKQIQEVQKKMKFSEGVTIRYGADHMADVWAVYAVKYGMTENYPYSVEVKDAKQREYLRSVYWDMTDVRGSLKRKGAEESREIYVEKNHYTDIMEQYGIQGQEALLKSLTTAEMRNRITEQFEQSILYRLNEEEFQKIETMIEGVEGERRAVLLSALSLEGKINYFWGGKSFGIGWDNRWGELYEVTSGGSIQQGSISPYGLDCSGFISWAFINAGGSADLLPYIGNGTAGQWNTSREIPMAEVLPGDLVFYQTPGSIGINHVGIVVKNQEQGIQVVHCNGSDNTVSVTGLSGFKYARRPYLYTE